MNGTRNGTAGPTLPGFPDGSYGWARVDQMLGETLGPRAARPSR